MLQLESKALDLPERAACVANLPRQHKQAVVVAPCHLSPVYTEKKIIKKNSP